MNSTAPNQSDLVALLECYENGHYDEAYKLAKTITKDHPSHPFAWKVLGALHITRENIAEALFANETVIKLDPNDPEGFYNLSNTLKRLGRVDEAIQGYKRSITIKPDIPEAHLNLGIALQESGRLQDAELHFRSAITLKPDFAQAYLNLGFLLQELARFDEAEISYRNAIAIKPNFTEAYHNLSITLLNIGDDVSALQVFAHLISFNPTAEAKSLFVDALKNVQPTTWDPILAEMVTSALLEPWGKPHDIQAFACQLLRLEPGFHDLLIEFENGGAKEIDLVKFPQKNTPPFSLLYALLISGPISDPRMERYFSCLRFDLIKTVNLQSFNLVLGDNEAFYCALAQQCFINEYIYYQTTEEIELSRSLRDQLVRELRECGEVSSGLIVSVACYFPLHTLKLSDALLRKQYSIDLMAVLKQQIQEPKEELEFRRTIPVLTGFEGNVSLSVQSQYEQNPYPRWVRMSAVSNDRSFNFFISKKYPAPNFSPLIDDKNLDVLVAGCGTGQHSISCYQVIKDANILAVDLSMASLGYAKRKTIEKGITAIEYAQADFLRLGVLGREFDVIEAVGVLHHIERPFEGWKALLSMLKPNGLMRVGLYSELGRKDIVKIRSLIDRDGIQSTPESIRNFRHRLLKQNNLEDIKYVTGGIDFYSMSACRDLLFHTQEHRMLLDVIDQFLKDNQLKFLGFDIDRSTLNTYKIRFPDDPFGLNLQNWHIFENENPNTFRQMYQLLVQKSL